MRLIIQRILCIILLVWVGSALGQEITVTADVNRTRLTIDDSLIFTILVSGSELENLPTPVLPDMAEFAVIRSTSSSSSQINLINGKTSFSKSIRFIYQLKPLDTGTLVIKSVSLNYNRSNYQTTSIPIEVLTSINSTVPQATQQKPGPTSPGSKILDEALYIHTSINKKQVYLGEQVTVSYTLYTRLRLTNARYEEIPSYTGFWVEELSADNRMNFTEEIISGKRYAVWKLREVILFPSITGELEISPLSMICDVQTERSRSRFFDNFFNDPFDSFFSNSRQIKVLSTAQTINVLPLPKDGRPADFNNAVGTFSLRAKVDQKTTEVNEPITLTIQLSGEGNLKIVETPGLPPLDNFKEYQSGNDAVYHSEQQRVSGIRTWDYVLIPTSAGTHTINSLSFSYFNPELDTYKTTSTKQIHITVRPSQNQLPNTIVPPQKARVTQLNSDIQYIKSEAVDLGDQGKLLFNSAWYVLLHALPIMAILATVFYRSYINRLQTKSVYISWRAAKAKAVSSLQEIEAKLEETTLEKAFTEISNTLNTYIGEKCNLPLVGLTSSQIIRLLKDRGVEEGTLVVVRECLEVWDMARFAPTALTLEHTQKMLVKTRKGIESIECQIMKEG